VLDTRQEQAQLAALEAQRELARLTFERWKGLLKEKVISKAEFDRATADLRQTDARVGEVRAVIQRKTIRAPFTGILGIRQVNLGQYLAGGDRARDAAVARSRSMRTSGSRSRRPHRCRSAAPFASRQTTRRRARGPAK
jgi:multidrug resistance efflux pump